MAKTIKATKPWHKAGTKYIRRQSKQVAKGMNAKIVERTDSKNSSDHKERQHYAEQMTALCGNTQIPAVQYKGTVVPRRVLSDFSYFTA